MPSIPTQSVQDPFHPSSLSDEQRAVVEAVAENGYNAIVNAVAGSGKTRTALATALKWLSHNPSPCSSRVVLLAYNKRLEQDMKKQRNGMSNPLASLIDVATVHGLARRVFGGTTKTDDGDLHRWTSANAPPKNGPLNYGLVIIDEAQDMYPILFKFLHFFIEVCIFGRPQLLVLGDPFQLLYRFKGADEDFILRADEKFADVCSPVQFKHFKLSISFRISHEVATWININLNPNNLVRARLQGQSDADASRWWQKYGDDIRAWWGDGIRANPMRPAEPDSLKYVKPPTEYEFKFGLRKVGKRMRFVDEIRGVFEQYDSERSVLITPSISPHLQSPVRVVTNRLSMINNEQQSWLIENNDGDANDRTSTDIRKNKRIATTIHKFKGCERDAVVVLGLDSFAEGREKVDCRNVFNVFYVAATRARKKLLIIQWNDQPYVTHSSRTVQAEDDLLSFDPGYEVTRALEFCQFDPVLSVEANDNNSCLQAFQAASCIPVPLDRDNYIVRGVHCSKRQRTNENVSAVIGTSVEVHVQLRLDEGKLQFPEFDQKAFDEAKLMPDTLKAFIRRINLEKVTKRRYTWSEILETATAILTITDRMYYRWRQVAEFHKWPIAGSQSYKLDEISDNLVTLLYIAFMKHGNCDGISQSSLEQQLAALKVLRDQKRLLMHEYMLVFDMSSNKTFADQCSATLVGQPDVTFISKKAADKLETDRHVTECCGPDDDVTIVEIKTTRQTDHNHVLQLACYGAMWKEQQSMSMKIEAKKKQFEKIAAHSQTTITDHACNTNEEKSAEKNNISVPTMYLVYPNLGMLKKVELLMDSYEFLHRIGCRKVGQPFTKELLEEIRTEDLKKWPVH